MRGGHEMTEVSVPLCVDLDGTLTSSDLLAESFLMLVKKNPVYLLACMVWLLKGRACLKAEIAKRISIDVSLLPYNQLVASFDADFVEVARTSLRHKSMPGTAR
jgi:hypothetical protein